jgi:hypothetical protein
MKAIAVGVLTTMLGGLAANALALWRDHGVMENRVMQVEKTQEKQDNTNKELASKIDNIHWYLIESKGIRIPPKEKR